MTPFCLKRFHHDGFAIVLDVVPEATIHALIKALEAVQDEAGVKRRRDIYAIRNLMEVVPAVRELADNVAIRNLIEPILGPQTFAVRSILFDKVPEANWKVTWHQDLTIAVRERKEIPGFGPWSEKVGIPHVQPPVSILERMLTLRLHLDDCDETNGPLQVIPHSHRYGRLSSDAIQQHRSENEVVTCTVPAGGALLMRPLLLHASSASQSPRHRRVIHIEFAAESLPGGLEWHSPDP